MKEFFTNGRASPDIVFLELNRNGRFVDTDNDVEVPVETEEDTVRFLQGQIDLPSDITDIYVWVHGWRYSEADARTESDFLYSNLDAWLRERSSSYSHLETIKPAYIYIHWPTLSSYWGYYRMRTLARSMTEAGDAEFVLSLLLGLLSQECQRRCTFSPDAGYKIHCMGHSFGGRFLVNAIREARDPRSGITIASQKLKEIDSLTVFQMAAPYRSYGKQFRKMLDTNILQGPIALTWSRFDRANRILHRITDWESGIGYRGLAEPREYVSYRTLNAADDRYESSYFDARITNIDASEVYRRGGVFDGSHGDIWHDETLHLIASVTSASRNLSTMV